MTIIPAILVKQKTADGLMEVHPDLRAGSTYQVILESKDTLQFLNTELNQIHSKEVIYATDGTYFPTELLKILYN